MPYIDKQSCRCWHWRLTPCMKLSLKLITIHYTMMLVIFLRLTRIILKPQKPLKVGCSSNWTAIKNIVRLHQENLYRVVHNNLLVCFQKFYVVVFGCVTSHHQALHPQFADKPFFFLLPHYTFKSQTHAAHLSSVGHCNHKLSQFMLWNYFGWFHHLEVSIGTALPSILTSSITLTSPSSLMIHMNIF